VIAVTALRRLGKEGEIPHMYMTIASLSYVTSVRDQDEIKAAIPDVDALLKGLKQVRESIGRDRDGDQSE